MFPGLLIGVLGGFAAARFASRRLHGRRGYRGCGGSLGPRFGLRRLFSIARQLDLDREQRRVLEEVAHQVRRAAGDARFESRGSLDALLESVAADSFDRARIEQLAAERGQSIGRVKDELVDGLARIHEVLRPEQRAKLRDLLGAAPPRESEGPYR